MVAIILDALIPRADFCEADGEQSQAQKLPSISLAQLGQDSFLVPTLRKPDFQRETNQWTGDQIMTFLKSFLDNELVPSVIFWRSPGKIFVIDGAHRLSALLAWINDDYGDGHKSMPFFDGQISIEQRRSAEALRKRINREIGSYRAFYDVMRAGQPEGVDTLLATRADNARTRTIDLQWVEGDAEKAESSFFKINKQGTPLDKVEERLLRLRRKPIAIAARSIVRAGSGHKYWSRFSDDRKREVEAQSKVLHNLLFSPELEFPIKTLNLPHGGKASPISAYNLLMDMLSYAVEGTVKEVSGSVLFVNDEDGSGTISALKRLQAVMNRITGNSPESLGLHPAVYFYSATGKHWDMVFVAMIKVIAKAVNNNDKEFFKKFIANRKVVEEIFLKNKSLIGQANIAIRSQNRIDKWADLIEDAARGKKFSEGVTASAILTALELEGKLVASEIAEAPAAFSESTKSAAFLATSIEKAHSCSLCGGLILAEKSVSYDHITPKSKGGTGGLGNIQLTHPYCNSLKGDKDPI